VLASRGSSLTQTDQVLAVVCGPLARSQVQLLVTRLRQLHLPVASGSAATGEGPAAPVANPAAGSATPGEGEDGAPACDPDSRGCGSGAVEVKSVDGYQVGAHPP
jgi:hypothetical protein